MRHWTPDDSMAIPGFMESDELVWLNAEAALARNVVEIGTWKGRSTLALARGCAGQVCTVDTFDGSPSERTAAHADALTHDIEEEARAALRDEPNVMVLSMRSLWASRLFPAGSVDMVFIDGDHVIEEALIDLVCWAPKARRLLCGHDRDWEGVLGALTVFGLPWEAGPGSIWYARMLGQQ